VATDGQIEGWFRSRTGLGGPDDKPFALQLDKGRPGYLRGVPRMLWIRHDQWRRVLEYGVVMDLDLVLHERARQPLMTHLRHWPVEVCLNALNCPSNVLV
jgi:hypothetical protein